MRGLFNASRASAGCFSGRTPDLAAFAAMLEGEEVHLAVSEETIAGFVSVWVPDRFIHHLYVSAQYQSHGVGSALLQACEAMYGRPLSLKCDVRNHRAQRFSAQGLVCAGDRDGRRRPVGTASFTALARRPRKCAASIGCVMRRRLCQSSG